MKVFALLALFFDFASTARILGFFAIPSISHQMVFRQLMFELSKRGHEVTVVTPNPLGTETVNYTEIDVGFVYVPYREKFSELAAPKLPEEMMWHAFDFMGEMMDLELSDPSVREMLRTRKYDLVFIEFIELPGLAVLGHHFGAPVIGITSLDAVASAQTLIGNPFNPAYYPEMILPYTDRKSLYERFRSLVTYVFWNLMHRYHWTPMHDAIAKKHFGPDTPHIAALEKNISMLFVYSDFRSYFPLPTVPAYLQIGGSRPFHMRQPQPLPQDLQRFLDSAKEGVIYFSLGSNVKSEAIPESKRRVFIEAFKQLKQKVLWKWEADVLPGKPDNVKIGKWLPQTDILPHPNVKAFITQGGLQSVSEATYNKVPMIVIPFFADQELNARKLVDEGVAIRIDYETLEVDSFLAALRAVLEDKGYKERMVKYSDLTQDQPQSPLDRAVWWTEYVIRHKGARHLRSPAVDMPWYQYFLLDVFAFLLAVLLIFLYIFYIVIRSIKRSLFRGNKVKAD